MNGRTCVRRNSDIQVECSAIYFPIANNLPANGMVIRAGEREITDRMRRDREMFEPGRGLIGIDARQGFVKPGADVPEHDVIPGIGAVPLFPKRGSALREPPTPARLVGLRNNPIGQIDTIIFEQRIQEIFRAKNSGVDVIATFFDRRNEIADDQGAVGRFNQSLI